MWILKYNHISCRVMENLRRTHQVWMWCGTSVLSSYPLKKNSVCWIKCLVGYDLLWFWRFFNIFHGVLKKISACSGHTYPKKKRKSLVCGGSYPQNLSRNITFASTLSANRMNAQFQGLTLWYYKNGTFQTRTHRIVSLWRYPESYIIKYPVESPA